MIARLISSSFALVGVAALAHAQESDPPRYLTVGPLSGGFSATYTLGKKRTPRYVDSHFVDLVQEKRGGRTATSLGFGVVHHHTQEGKRESFYVDLGLGLYGTQARSSVALGLGGKLGVGVETKEGYLAELAYRVLPSASGIRPARNRIQLQLGKRF